MASLALLLGGGALASAATAPTALEDQPETVVSITFDDGTANQMTAAATLDQYDLDGTFYVMSGYVGAANYLTRANLDSLAAAGHEIGGHTINHPDLTTVPAAEAVRQICNDRAALTSWGFTIRSLAYPYAASTPALETTARDCGYTNARMLGDIASRFGCAECDTAESIPPANPFYLKALDQVESTWTLADMQTAVTTAESTGGGWVPFTFHNICESGCGDPTTTPALFEQFVQWLAARESTNNTVVRTVGDVIGTAAQPVVSGPVAAPLAPGVNGIGNPSLETAAATGSPECWMQGGYGENVAAFSTVSPGRTGATASKVVVSGYVSGDAKLLPQFDGGSCSPTILPGHTYSLRTWYKSTAVTQFAVYLRTSAGAWQYWTSSPWFAASTDYTEAVWTSPAIPAGMTGISFGLNLFSNGEITTDDYSLYDTDGAPAPSVPPVVAPVAATTVGAATQ
jgi:peptidoglycan/xylan/chitin deacetylase (PgdA/CDA1 family)